MKIPDVLLREMDEDLYREFKAKAALKGLGTPEAGIEAVKEWVKKK